MLQFVLLLLYFSRHLELSCCSEGKPNIDLRIANGNPTDIEGFLFQVTVNWVYGSLVYFKCSGAIISPWWVVCAAHCVYKKNNETIRLQSGSNYKFKGGTFHDVSLVLSHPKFHQADEDYDVAVVMVKKPFELGEGLKSIRIPRHGPYVNTHAVLSGWTMLSAERGRGSDEILKHTAYIISKQECAKHFKERKITDRMFCALVRDSDKELCNKGVTTVDSGSLLVANRELIGIEYLNGQCGAPANLFTKIFPYRSWITEVTGVH